MKKSIRGNIKAKTQADKESIVADINKYLLWKLDTRDVEDEEGNTSFSFEAWVENDQDEAKLFTDMKKHVDKHKLKSKIDRHDCTHDEKDKKPCKIAEEYSAE
jgi:hypothetical protein